MMEFAILEGHDWGVRSVSFSPDGKFLASGSYDWTVKVWEVGSWREVANLGHGGLVRSVSFSPDGKFLASGSEDRTVKVWEVGSWREVANLGHEGGVLSVSFSPDGKFLASGSSDKTVKVWGWGLRGSLKGKIHHDLDVVERWQKEWEQIQKEWEQRQKERRRAQGLCEECGKPLSFWDKLLGQTKCPQCR